MGLLNSLHELNSFKFQLRIEMGGELVMFLKHCAIGTSWIKTEYVIKI